MNTNWDKTREKVFNNSWNATESGLISIHRSIKYGKIQDVALCVLYQTNQTELKIIEWIVK